MCAHEIRAPLLDARDVRGALGGTERYNSSRMARAIERWMEGSRAFLWASLALAPAAFAQESDESGHTPRIGIYLATHLLPGANFVCRGAAAARHVGLRGPSTDLGLFSISHSGSEGLSVFDGRTVEGLRGSNGRALVPSATAPAVAGLDVSGDGDANFAFLVHSLGSVWYGVVGFLDDEPLVNADASRFARLRDPSGLCLGDRGFYVADRGNHRVQKFSNVGAPLAQVGSRGTTQAQFIRPTDVTVDRNGFVYVVDTGNHRVQKFDAELKFVKSWGAFGPHPGFFAFPEGIDCFEDRLYVVDTDNHRVQVFDLEGALLYEWGLHALAPREGAGKLHYPRDVAVARTTDGLVALVTEPFEDRFQVFRETKVGEELPKPAIPDRVIAAHFGPHLDIAEDLIAMFEPGAPSLLLYDIEHQVQPWEPVQVSRMAAWGRRIGQFRCPTDVAIDAQRRLVYVADADSGVLACYRFAHTRESPLEYNPFEFKLVRSLDLDAQRELVTPERNFAIQPEALELHPSGELYVLDALQNAVFVFTPDFELARALELSQFGGECSLRLTDLAFSRDGKRLYVVDELRGDLCIVELGVSESPSGARIAAVAVRPGGVAVAPNGEVYVSDSASHSIVRLDAHGARLANFGAPGIGRVQFHKPRGLAFDEQGRLWVVDWGNHRGQVLTPSGEFVAAFGSRLFTKPTR